MFVAAEVSNHNFFFLFPAQPIPDQQPAAKGVAKFDFTAESEDELTLKVCVCIMRYFLSFDSLHRLDVCLCQI